MCSRWVKAADYVVCTERLFGKYGTDYRQEGGSGVAEKGNVFPVLTTAEVVEIAKEDAPDNLDEVLEHLADPELYDFYASWPRRIRYWYIKHPEHPERGLFWVAVPLADRNI